jgi:hypothetical protein
MQMPTRISYVILLIAILFTAAEVEAQQQRQVGEIDLAVTYTANRANLTTNPSFWMQGGSAELAGQLWHGLAGVANITGLHTGGGDVWSSTEHWVPAMTPLLQAKNLHRLSGPSPALRTSSFPWPGYCWR